MEIPTSGLRLENFVFLWLENGDIVLSSDSLILGLPLMWMLLTLHTLIFPSQIKNLVIISICFFFFLNHRMFCNYLSESWLVSFSRFLQSWTYFKQTWSCHRQILITINGCQSAHVEIWFVWPLVTPQNLGASNIGTLREST